jgi:hypothetical protein
MVFVLFLFGLTYPALKITRETVRVRGVQEPPSLWNFLSVSPITQSSLKYRQNGKTQLHACESGRFVISSHH